MLAVRADLSRRRITLLYDMTRLDYRQVLETLAKHGFTTPDSRWTRLKLAGFRGLIRSPGTTRRCGPGHVAAGRPQVRSFRRPRASADLIQRKGLALAGQFVGLVWGLFRRLCCWC